MENVELIMELEQLKQKLAHYETVIQPLANRELQRLREQAVKEYKLTDEEAKIMAERLADVSTEEGINATAVQLAGEFRATNAPKYIDASGMGNGNSRSYKQTSPQSVGKQAYQRLKQNGRLNKTISSVKIDTPPVKQPETVKQRGIIGRLFNR